MTQLIKRVTLCMKVKIFEIQQELAQLFLLCMLIKW